MVRLPKQEDLVQMIIEEGIIDLRLLQALREVPRARFVPPDFEGQAYLDEPLPIPHGQVTTQPSLIAKMVEALGLKGSEKVLEIGTGYGFQTALLARLAAFVWSIELWDDIAETARTHLSRQGIANAEVVVGDGSEGLAQQAPFDAIIVSAAFPETPKPLIEQLAPSGRLIQPIGSGGDEAVILFEKREKGLIPRRTVTRAHFVRLYGKHGFPQGPEV
jgi:protein-L-isoaspartate(D-aspartate) O-methyltransferase